jgi:predicted O-linked N-acetylglucosamine transferase (SPINDLY family)
MAREAPPAAFQHAVMLYQQRRLDGAEKLLEQMLQRNAGHADALHLLGIIAQETGRPQRAASLLGKAVKLKPRAAPLHDALASTLNDLGRKTEALAHWNKAVELDPGFADAWVNRGSLLKSLNRTNEAVASYDRALALAPNFAEAYFNVAVVLGSLGRFDEALDRCDRAIALMPDFVEAHFSRGTILANLRRDAEALTSFEQAIARKPDHAEAYYNIGTSLLGLGRAREAIGYFDRAIALKPDHAEAYHNRGAAQQELALFGDAIASQEKALALRPDFAFLEGDLLQLRLAVCGWHNFIVIAELLTVRAMKGEQVFAPFAALLATHDPILQRRAAEIYVAAKYPADGRLGPTPHRSHHDKIRIGYFSADFREHPVSYLMVGLFENHDRALFHTVGFALGPDTWDPMAARVASGFDKFIDGRTMSDQDIARLARENCIDIAVDLGGFTLHARPGIFALRAAPVQVSYIGYLGTMGAQYIDYIVADPIMIPEGDRRYYAEKIAYLPSFQSNTTDRPVSATPVARADAGLPETGFVFCCFNNNFKILPDIFDAWVRILKAVPGGVLWLYVSSDAAKHNIRATASERGFDPERIVFAQRVSRPDYMARLRLADLFLDTAPYNAGTTASDALWMGLPVLTLLGTTFAGRMGASLLTAIGIPELIVETLEQYEAMAIALAKDPARLMEIARKLAENRSTTRLFDTSRFARTVEAAYTAMVARHAAGLPPDHIDLSAG